MPRRLKYDIPGVDWRVTQGAVAERGWPGLFAGDVERPLPLVVELGYGRGEFLLERAKQQPQQAFVGIELSFRRSLKMARRLARSELRNVRLCQGRAEIWLGESLADASVACFWINFPDPWPKARHVKRRLIQPELTALLARRLIPGGALRIATDDAAYAEWIDAVLRAEPALENQHAPEPFAREEPDRTPTAYELEWRAEGRPLHFFRYARRARTP
jgi:tRNA (guanine-N7-)-methyltransferase